VKNVLGLTTRERQVMELLEQGLATTEVARRLQIAPATARRHIGSAAGRLGAVDRLFAVAAYRLVERYLSAAPNSRDEAKEET
jgi:DNA-binding NarL/FixJ family response regulator